MLNILMHVNSLSRPYDSVDITDSLIKGKFDRSGFHVKEVDDWKEKILLVFTELDGHH